VIKNVIVLRFRRTYLRTSGMMASAAAGTCLEHLASFRRMLWILFYVLGELVAIAVPFTALLAAYLYFRREVHSFGALIGSSLGAAAALSSQVLISVATAGLLGPPAFASLNHDTSKVRSPLPILLIWQSGMAITLIGAAELREARRDNTLVLSDGPVTPRLGGITPFCSRCSDYSWRLRRG
jgi:hypothetical protein